MYGRDMSNLRVFAAALPQDPSGVFQVQNRFTGRSSIVAYQKVEDFPLIVTVALDRSATLAGWRRFVWVVALARSEEHTSELQSLMRISYAVFCLKKKNHSTP